MLVGFTCPCQDILFQIQATYYIKTKNGRSITFQIKHIIKPLDLLFIQTFLKQMIQVNPILSKCKQIRSKVVLHKSFEKKEWIHIVPLLKMDWKRNEFYFEFVIY